MPQVTCPACMASYDVPVTALGGAGRRLRCAACKSLFLATPPGGYDADEALVDAAKVAADAARATSEADIRLVTPGIEPVQTPQLRPLPQRPLPWHRRLGAVNRRRPASAVPLVAMLVVIASLAGLAAFRRQIVTAMPETASLYAALRLPVNLRGLELREIKSGLFAENGVDLLVVQGEIVNVTGKKQPVPPLAFTVRDQKGQAVYSWMAGADVTSLEPGGRATFRRRLASPPADGTEVLVRFAPTPAVAALGSATSSN